MTEIILVAVGAGALVGAVLVLFLSGRVAAAVRAALADRLEGIDRGQERIDRAVREELGKNREESAATAGRLREELGKNREESSTVADRLRDELSRAHKDAADSTKQELKMFGERLDGLTKNLELKVGVLTESSEKRLDGLRATVDDRLKALQEDNGKRLDQMRETVDEKLQGTLEKRLNDSFKLVSERLEAVQRGLGEMHSLAAGVGDLKKVLTNVKTRGTLGEVQLGALLEQMLAPDQYVRNAAPRKEGGERVEFAVRLPGPEDGSEVLLPIDAKFPVEDYQRLVEASEKGEAAAVEAASRALEVRIKGCAKDIRDKYLNPPRTTDFGILFLPTEGLYAEIVRRPGLFEALQREYKVSVAGPTTLTAILNSLQMGFRTLAIQKRSSEVWQVLGAVKAEFGKFGEVIEKVEQKLSEASDQLSNVGRRGRAIERKLKDVQALPAGERQQALPAIAIAGAADEVEAV
jgi:DNA recombination protein RmuC